jgi:hypothetical protein
MIKKQTKNTYTQLEKVLTLAGLTLVIVGCLANIYSAPFNLHYANDPIDYIYYFRYLILLGGGVTIGYLFTRQPASQPRHSKLFAGASYAVLAIALYLVLDLARFGLQGLFGTPPFPWGKLIFMGGPLLAIIITMIIAYFLQYKSNQPSLSIFTKIAIILSFIAYQVYTLVSGTYYLIIGTATYDPNMPIWVIIGSYLIIPLVITIVSYALLNNIKKSFDRLFNAVLIGTLYSSLSFVLWEFRTDVSIEATNIFSNLVVALTLLFAGVLLWQARKAVK